MTDSIDLEQLFNDLDPLIQSTLNRIAYLYRYRWPADFEDIQQLVRLDVWKFLPKLLTLATTKDSLTRLVVTAINYSFKSHYRDIRRRGQFLQISHMSDLQENAIPTVDTHARTERVLDLATLVVNILKYAHDMNRWKGVESDAVNYCILTLLHGREPSRKVIKSVYGLSKGMYLINYSRTLLKICVHHLTTQGHRISV